MDAFYASVEQRDFPEYKGKPLIVGGSPEGRGGVVATASYEARKYGVHSAMPSKKALRLCPNAIFVFPRFEVYKKVSQHLHSIFHRYTDFVEPLSLDEAYLDVTNDKLGIGYAIEIAQQIKNAIWEELHLTASAGISINKFVAKVASDMNKPNGLTFIGPSRIESFMEELGVEKFYGVGKVTAAKMNAIGLYKGADLKRLSEPEMIRNFGKSGKFFYNIVRGLDTREVQPYRATKSISVEDTYLKDLTTEETIWAELKILVDRLFLRLERKGLKGRTITVKFKWHDFTLLTRSQSAHLPIREKEDIWAFIEKILQNTDLREKKIRLLGIGMSNFGICNTDTKNPFDPQLKLF